MGNVIQKDTNTDDEQVLQMFPPVEHDSQKPSPGTIRSSSISAFCYHKRVNQASGFTPTNEANTHDHIYPLPAPWLRLASETLAMSDEVYCFRQPVRLIGHRPTPRSFRTVERCISTGQQLPEIHIRPQQCDADRHA